MIRRPPRSTRTDTLCPYTTLFRSKQTSRGSMATFALSFNDNMLSGAAMDDIETGGKQEHHGVGHRERLRRRLFDGGPDALLDHELVDYLLALAIPRRDTKPLAKQLLTEFGGLGGLLTAARSEERRVGKECVR